MLALSLVTVLGLGSCGGSGSTSDQSASTVPTDTTIAPLAPVRSSDPSVPVAVALGGRFELLLPADPTRGRRWVLEPVDTSIVVPLSSEFLDDPELLASSSTTTTVPPDVTTEPTVTLLPTTTTTLDPDSPEAGPLVQVIAFAGRSPATTQIRLRYERLGEADGDARTVTFTVVVYAEQS